MSALTLHFTVAMPQPQTHLFEVSLVIANLTVDCLNLKFPVWTPGSYLVREYARHLQEFSAQDAQGNKLPWRKVSKNHWQVACIGQSQLTVCYRIFANELTVRTNHLDKTHGYFNPAAMFFRIPGQEDQPITLTVLPPYPDWQVSTPLTATDQPNTFRAANFDELVDSPVEVGTHVVHTFEVLGKPHQFAIWGSGPIDIPKLLSDTQKIITAEAELFDGLPYDRYLFLLHLTNQAYGGLEHRSSCSLIYSRFGLRNPDGYEKFMSLVAHEFFHLWNVKRIRPKGLEVFDYDQENYTDALWFCEGTTSFYDLIFPLRAGLYNAEVYLSHVSWAITQLQTTPGRKIQPLSESSFDAWIKLYRPDADSRNSQVSYYLKGELVSFLLDLLIRAQHQNQRSLDDVMHQMWQRFGQPEIGFTREELQETFATVAGLDLTAFWAKYIDGTEELPFGQLLLPFGLELKVDMGSAIPYLGLTTGTEAGRTLIRSVEANSPAAQAGLEPGDELLAIDGVRITAEQLNERLLCYAPEDKVTLTVFHQDLLQNCNATLQPPVPGRYGLLPTAQPTVTQQELFRGWLGWELSSLAA
jgi:predicted metalloprotease with PDZ domain